MPTELLYRAAWASTASIEVPVKDFETCDGGWFGTITYVEQRDQKVGAYETSSRNHREAIEVRGNTATSQGVVNTNQIYENQARVGNSCGLTFRRHFVTGNEQRNATVRVVLDGSGNYTLFVNVPSMEVTERKEISACGHGNKEDMTLSDTFKSYGLAINNIQGTLDPANPVEISGGADVNEFAKLTWNLKRCQ